MALLAVSRQLPLQSKRFKMADSALGHAKSFHATKTMDTTKLFGAASNPLCCLAQVKDSSSPTNIQTAMADSPVQQLQQHASSSSSAAAAAATFDHIHCEEKKRRRCDRYDSSESSDRSVPTSCFSLSLFISFKKIIIQERKKRSIQKLAPIGTRVLIGRFVTRLRNRRFNRTLENSNKLPFPL